VLKVSKIIADIIAKLMSSLDVVVLKEHHGHLSRLQSRQQMHQVTKVDRMHDEDM